jgi:predicted dienelactone hydrolase
VAVVQTFIDARNAGDIDAALATFAANALYVGGGSCAAATPCMGADAVRRNLEGQKSVHVSASIVSMQVSGSAVIGRVEGRGDPISAAGIDRNVSAFIAQVPQDKIADWFQVPDLTDTQTAQYTAAQAQAQQTPAPDPEPGPYAVGVTRRTFVRASSTTGKPRYLNTVIWYPADAAAASLPRNGLLAAPLDATPARSGAPYPVILWSHPNGGDAWYSTYFTTHLASYGFVVIAPPHPGNTSDTCPIPCIPINPPPAVRDAQADSAANRPDDISFALDQALSLSGTHDVLLAGLLDGKRVGVAGHSFGGATVFPVLARDSRFLAGVAFAPWATGAGAPIAGPAAPRVTVPVMVMSGLLDDLVPIPAQQDLFAALPASVSSHWFLAFPRAGHAAFRDLCPSERAGCSAADLPPAEAHVRINHWATAFLVRYVAGDERQAASLDAALAQDDPEVVVTRAP